MMTRMSADYSMTEMMPILPCHEGKTKSKKGTTREPLPVFEYPGPPYRKFQDRGKKKNIVPGEQHRFCRGCKWYAHAIMAPMLTSCLDDEHLANIAALGCLTDGPRNHSRSNVAL